MYALQCVRAIYCYINPLLVPALVTGGLSAVGSIFSGIFGSTSSNKNAQRAVDSQRETNETNLRMSQETNETNRQIAENVNQTNIDLARLQNDWNLEQWNRENEYNSPQHQVELYRAAGLNPAMIGGNFIPANSVQSAPMANQQMYSFDSSQIQDPERNATSIRESGTLAQIEMLKTAFDSVKNIYKDYEDIKNIEQNIHESNTRERLNLYDLRNIRPEQVKYWKENISYLHGKNWLQDNINPELALQSSIQTDLLDVRKRIAYIDLYTKEDYRDYLRTLYEGQQNQNQLLRIAIKYAPQLNRSQIKMLESQAYRNYVEGDHTKYILDYRMSNGGYSPEDDLQAALGVLSSETSKYSADSSSSAHKYSADMSYKSAIYRSSQSPIAWVASGISAIGAGVGIWSLVKNSRVPRKISGFTNSLGGALSLPVFEDIVDNILFPYSSKKSQFGDYMNVH